MKFTRLWEIRDADDRLRFSSVFKVDAEFFIKRLLQRTKPGQKKPMLLEIPFVGGRAL